MTFIHIHYQRVVHLQSYDDETVIMLPAGVKMQSLIPVFECHQGSLLSKASYTVDLRDHDIVSRSHGIPARYTKTV